MAIRIPTPEYQGAQRLGGMQAEAANTPFQDLRLPDTTFNSRMLQQIGGKGVEFAEYLQQQDDERGLLELQAGLGDWERQLLYGEMSDGSPSGDPGILGLEEKDAFGVADRVQKAFDENLLGYDLTGLSRSGRLAAQKYTQRQREALLNQATRHEFNQRQAYNNRLRRQAEAAAAARSRVAWSSPDEMAASEKRLVAATINRATNEAATTSAPGLETAEQREAYVDSVVAENVERFRRDAIARAIATGGKASVARGREIYDQSVADGSITIENEDDPIVQIVTFGEQVDVVVNGATEIFERFPDDLGAAITEARRRNYDGDTERDLVNEVTRRFQTAAVVQGQENEQRFEQARLAANKGTLLSDFDRIELFKLTPAQRTELGAINSGSSPVGDRQVYNYLRSMSDAKVASLDLETYLPELNTAEYDALVTQQNQARERQVFEDAKLSAAAGTLDQDFTEEQLRRFTLAQREDLRAIEMNLDPIGDMGLFHRLRDLPSSELAEFPLEGLVTRLNPTEYSTLFDKRIQARAAVAGDLAARSEYTATQSTLATINAGITGILEVEAGEEANTTEVTQRLLITNLVDDWIYGKQLVDGRPPTSSEITNYISSLKEPVLVSTGVFGRSTKPRWAVLTREVTVSLVVEGVPPADVAEIARVLASRPMPVTPDAIRALYDLGNK